MCLLGMRKEGRLIGMGAGFSFLIVQKTEMRTHDPAETESKNSALIVSHFSNLITLPGLIRRLTYTRVHDGEYCCGCLDGPGRTFH